MEETVDDRALALLMRNEVLEQLAALATDREAAKNLMQRFHFFDKKAAPFSRYASLKSPILAMVAFLKEQEEPHPMTASEIENALCAERWGGGGKDARTKIRQSLNGFKTSRIKEINGRIGLREWHKDLFLDHDDRR